MRKSLLLKALLFAAFPLFATDDDTASAAPSSTDASQDKSAADATAATTADASAPTADAAAAVDSDASDASDASQDATDAAPADTADAPTAAAPIVQTPTPVAQPGSAGDPVLETVKTPAHNVAEEIQAEIKKLEQLPAEVAAWFESKFVELAGHIKALL